MVNILFSKEQSELNSLSTNNNNNNSNNQTGNTSNNYSVNKINLINHVPLTEQPNSAYQQIIPIRNRNNTGIIFNPSLKNVNKPFVTTRIKITNQNGNKISGLQVQEETKNIKKRSSIDCENGFQGRGFTGLHHNYSSSDIRRVPVRAVLTDQQKDKGSITNLKKGNEFNLLNQ